MSKVSTVRFYIYTSLKIKFAEKYMLVMYLKNMKFNTLWILTTMVSMLDGSKAVSKQRTLCLNHVKIILL